MTSAVRARHHQGIPVPADGAGAAGMADPVTVSFRERVTGGGSAARGLDPIHGGTAPTRQENTTVTAVTNVQGGGTVRVAGRPRPRPGRRHPAPQPHWWDEPRMRTALAARDIRTVLALLQERGMSQRALAERTGFSQGEIHEILRRGRRVLSYDVLARVADMLPVARWRMGLSAEPPADPGCPRCTKARGSPPPVGADTDAPTPPRGRSLEPPPRWWNQPNVLTALAAHDFRTVFGHLRALGLTSYDIATRTGLRPSPVDSVVAGCGGITAYDDILAVCHGLGIDRGAAGIAYLDPTGPSAALDERSGQEPGLPQAWTGMHTRALRLSMRHTVAGFAARANVSDRTIQLWESGAAAVRPRREIQWRLDAIYTAQPPHTRALYAHLLAEAAAGPPDPGSPR